MTFNPAQWTTEDLACWCMTEGRNYRRYAEAGLRAQEERSAERCLDKARKLEACARALRMP